LKQPEKAIHEKAVGEGWFAGNYTSKESVELIAEMQGLSMEMIEYWYGRRYHEQERASHGYY